MNVLDTYELAFLLLTFSNIFSANKQICEKIRQSKLTIVCRKEPGVNPKAFARTNFEPFKEGA